ncbi:MULTISPECIES: phosphoenolpyruvate carboxykinase (GTP) [unclassified Brevibacterium]|uniref:phosphoenolpyruvate carboxykinase (GTP) n=1 Tax=unclassified Brevibacterium TaxID=2614124 RepID=UPI0010C7B3F5|nr:MULTISPECIES: phosphoenolpyruvate carboxykinase (GTP) [Actinomycetes]MCK1802920.1 phosphoenolpyruvate carboxykinase (GTP) [Brevibacterium sp. R8603A2]MCX0277829.1 phosphoenolpyruvate carboxykinase (GTP) [Nocardia zapadnayensis]QCP04161.1 phosphoenolpyruvate carboxykinase (GTP) [Brevibacterium sp. CS2]
MTVLDRGSVEDQLKAAPTSNEKVLSFVRSVAELATPDRIEWVTGDRAQRQEIANALVAAGTLIKLDKQKDSYYAASDPDDVARVEDRTYICTHGESGAGPLNNWMDPQEMKGILNDLFTGSMKGRTMYVIPFVMGHVDAKQPMFGIEVTDSPYVVLSMLVMARCGTTALKAIEKLDADFVECVHSVGAPLAEGEDDVPWPCNTTKYITHFPEDRAIWSFGSGYGGNALLGKKCYALRIASAIAHDEGWLAEHMLIIKLTNPEGESKFIAAAFPSACGKTNLAMIEPTIPGWKAETLGDDIAWMRFGEDGRLYAVNPEFGLFGVAPGTGYSTNPTAMRAIEAGGNVFTNVALTDDGDVWWEGMTDEAPAHLTDWRGNDWTPESDTPAAHPNSRFCTPIENVPTLAPEWENPDGVPISAILFGGRRKTTMPLITQTTDWNHGVFMGTVLSSETTAAATGKVGVVRRDPMAMRPFIGYNVGDYFQHWLNIGATEGAQLPEIFYVNWFRRDEDNSFLWPGFSENSRVLKWIFERVSGTAEAVETPLGYAPAEGALDIDGLDITPEQVQKALAIKPEEWDTELESIEAWYAELGDAVPAELKTQVDKLRARLDLA